MNIALHIIIANCSRVAFAQHPRSRPAAVGFTTACRRDMWSVVTELASIARFRVPYILTGAGVACISIKERRQANIWGTESSANRRYRSKAPLLPLCYAPAKNFCVLLTTTFLWRLTLPRAIFVPMARSSDIPDRLAIHSVRPDARVDIRAFPATALATTSSMRPAAWFKLQRIDTAFKATARR